MTSQKWFFGPHGLPFQIPKESDLVLVSTSLLRKSTKKTSQFCFFLINTIAIKAFQKRTYIITGVLLCEK
jgi:hypothetical protein